MKLAHNIKISVFAHQEEDQEKVAKTLTSLCPFDLGQQKIEIKKTIAKGFNDQNITIFEIFLQKTAHSSKFLDSLKQKLTPDQRDLLLKQAESRLDEELNFFIRFDKTKLLQENELWITDSGNCFHIKITIAAYPANKRNGLNVIQKWLTQG